MRDSNNDIDDDLFDTLALADNSHESLCPEDDSRKLFSFANIGLVISPAISISLSTLLLSLYYQFFIVYLGVSGNLHTFYAGAHSIAQILSVSFALLSDGYPIFGRRRKPYQIIAWILFILTCVLLLTIPLPPPRHVFSTVPSINTSCEMLFQERLQKPCFRDADTYLNYGLLYIIIIAFAVVFLNCAGATSNGLIVDWSTNLPIKSRGILQTYVIVLTSILNGMNSFILGFGFNWYKYAGPWCQGLTMTQLFGIFAILGFIGLFSTTFNVTEERKELETLGIWKFLTGFWETCQMVSWNKLTLFVFFASGSHFVTSPADSMILQYWIKQESLTGTWSAIASQFLSALTIGLFSTYIVNGNWRYVLIGIQAVFSIVNMTLTNLAIFNVLRNQYLYTPDIVFKNVNLNMYLVLIIIFGVEYTKEGFEATFVTCLMLALNAGSAFFNQMAVFIAAPFDVSTAGRYINDSRTDEIYVASANLIFNCINFFGLFSVIKLMPKNKMHCKYLKETTDRSTVLGYLFIGGLIGINIFNITLTLLMPYIQKKLAH